MSPTELCRRARITQRELSWWSNTGVITSTRTARGRDFDDDQAVVAALVAQLRRRGVTLHRIRTLHIRRPQGEYLVISRGVRGITVSCWCSEHTVIERVAECPGACLVVSVEDLKRRLYDQTAPRFSTRSRN
jgi:DNA-binding transcriptional MerR regulator